MRSGVARVALVGYTNAGKSTLLNRLTHSDALVEDQLFSTLDPTTRRLRLPGGETVLVSDTVGFVQRLPHQLVEAFRSTLEEVVDADLLVHVVDASRPDAERADRRGATRCCARSAPATCPSCWCGTRPTSRRPDDVERAARERTAARSRCRARRATASTSCATRDRRAAARARPTRRAASCPTTAATCSPRCIATARCSSRCTTTTAPACGPACPTRSLARFRGLRHDRGLSVVTGRLARDGDRRAVRAAAVPVRPSRRAEAASPTRCPAASSTARSARPCDPVPDVVAQARGRRGSRQSMGYPPSIGTAALRDAVAAWMRRRLDVDVAPDARRRVRRHQGDGRVAPALPRRCATRRATRCCTRPSRTRRTTMGATLAGLPRRAGSARRRLAPRPRRDQRRRRRARARALDQRARQPVVVGGRRRVLRARRGVGPRPRRRVASDECYVEFAPRAGTTILARRASTACSRCTASRSARTSPACASASSPAIPSSSHYLVETRKHAGFMVPTPAQAAARRRARRRRARRRAARALRASAATLVLERLETRRARATTAAPMLFYLWLRDDDGRRRLGDRRPPRAEPACSCRPATSTATPARALRAARAGATTTSASSPRSTDS